MARVDYVVDIKATAEGQKEHRNSIALITEEYELKLSGLLRIGN